MPPRNPASQKRWTAVDQYFGDLLAPADSALEAAIAANREAGLPPIDVTPLQGKFLAQLVRISGARRVLELGTLGGYSTIWLARALPSGGQITTLELAPHHAEVARANLLNAGVLDRVDLRVGPALDTLITLVAANAAPFDLIFIDADKVRLPGISRTAPSSSRAPELSSLPTTLSATAKSLTPKAPIQISRVCGDSPTSLPQNRA